MSQSEKTDPSKDDIQQTVSSAPGTVSRVFAFRSKKKTETVIEDAEQYLVAHVDEYGDYTEAEAKAVLRRIDWRMMPLFMMTLTIAGVDVGVTFSPL